MLERTTVELDSDLVNEALKALDVDTLSEALDLALRHAIEEKKREFKLRAEKQRAYLENLLKHLDLKVLASGEMWR